MRVPDMQKRENTMRVWDPIVRLFHWSLVVGITMAWLTSSIRGQAHQWIGLVVGGLVALRILWGFCGSRYARFSDFIRSPRAIAAYIYQIVRGKEKRYVGHNPAGGAMVVALVMMILLTIFTGWLMTTDTYYGDDFMQAVHSICAYTVLTMVVFHLFGVILASMRHHENLVRAMITGRKRQPSGDDIA